VGWDGEVLLPAGGLAAQSHMAAALSGDAVAIDRQPSGQVRTVEVAVDLYRASNSCRT